MSVMYATASELAGFLQQDLDTYTATQALQQASAIFDLETGSTFAGPTSATYTLPSTGVYSITLPRTPVVAVQSVTVAGTSIGTDFTLIGNTLHRVSGFGWGAFPPQVVVVTYTYGYTSAPDEVKNAVLQIAASQYQRPDSSIASEQVDDYVVRYNGTPIPPGLPWREVASKYRLAGVA